jgi:hypothetical protein
MDYNEGCDRRFFLHLSTKHLYGSVYSQIIGTYRLAVQMEWMKRSQGLTRTFTMVELRETSTP